jgi:predicted dehydrogenase
VARPFLERGVSALIEKPLASVVEEAEEAVALAAMSGARLQVGHIERFNPAFQAVVKRGIRPVFVESHRMSPFRFRSVDVGVVFDLMIHDLDIIQHLVGSEIERIDAAGVNVISPHEDIASVRLSFANGCVANVTASRVSVKSMRKIRIFARESYVSIDTEAREVLVYTKKPGFEKTAKRLREGDAGVLAQLKALAFGDLVQIDKLRIDEDEPLRAELASFVRAVREGRRPEVSGADGLAAVRAAARILDGIRGRLQRMGWNAEI